MAQAIVGQSIPRIDGLPKVTGNARYIADLSLPGMLHAAVMRSPHPHALLKRIDAGEARKVPGVKAVLTGPDILKMEGIDPFYGPAYKDQPILAVERVRHVGEAVAAVAADTREAAEEALSLVRVEYEPIPAVHTVLDAVRPDAPLVHENIVPANTFADLSNLKGGKSNINFHFKLRKGDAEKALKEAAVVFEDDFISPPASHAHLEPHGVLARWDANGKLTLWSGTQSPSLVRIDLAGIYGVPLNRVRVIVPYLGGAYGGKLYDKLEPITTLLAKVTMRPVRWILNREEVFVTTSKHGAVCRMRTGVSTEGRISVRKVAVYYDTGAYAEVGPRIAYKTGFTAAGPYRIPNVWIDSYCVYTHKTPAGPFRGFGVPQVAFAYETHMEKVAHHLGRDPVELRLEYAYEEGDFFASGTKLHSLGHKDSLIKCAEAIGWTPGPRKPPSSLPARGKRRGKGCALGLKSVLTPSTSGAILEMGSGRKPERPHLRCRDGARLGHDLLPDRRRGDVRAVREGGHRRAGHRHHPLRHPDRGEPVHVPRRPGDPTGRHRLEAAVHRDRRRGAGGERRADRVSRRRSPGRGHAETQSHAGGYLHPAVQGREGNNARRTGGLPDLRRAHRQGNRPVGEHDGVLVRRGLRRGGRGGLRDGDGSGAEVRRGRGTWGRPSTPRTATSRSSGPPLRRWG